MKKIIIFLLVISMLFVLASCESNRINRTYDIMIEDIEWSVEESVIDGQRVVSFGYTNNTPYIIADIELKFTQKADLTLDQLSAFDGLKQKYNWDEKKLSETYILGYNRKLTNPGESVSESPCVVNGTYILVENMEQYELMQPDLMTIAYIPSDKKIHLGYYDFKNQKFTSSSDDAIDAYNWSNSKISSRIPKPSAPVTQLGVDEEDEFSFKAYGVSKTDYDEYINQCKEKGFVNVENSSTKDYEASDDEGYIIDVKYNSIEAMMYGEIESEK